jgi:hypothetical protein
MHAKDSDSLPPKCLSSTHARVSGQGERRLDLSDRQPWAWAASKSGRIVVNIIEFASSAVARMGQTSTFLAGYLPLLSCVIWMASA